MLDLSRITDLARLVDQVRDNGSQQVREIMDQLGLSDNFTFNDLVHILNETSSQRRWFSPPTETVLMLAYVLVILVGFLLNSAICYVVVSRKSMRTIRNMFIFNLAVSDLVMCLFCMPSTLVKLLVKDWILGEFLCRTIPWLQATNVFASTITITAIALDRYHVIMYPCVSKEGMRVFGAALSLIAIWITSAIVGLPLLINSHVVTESYLATVSFTFCREDWSSYEAKYAYAAVVLVLQFVLPIILLFILHWRISNFLKSRINQNPHTHEELNRTLKEARRHRKNTTLLMAIAITYALCWFPLTLLNFLADFNYKMFMEQDFLIAFACAHLIAMMSAIANPILYGWFNTNFKNEFIKFASHWPQNQSQQSSGSNANAGSLERQRLVGSRIVQQHDISYKAIQTEVQPPMKALLNRNSTEEEHIISDP